MGIRLDKVIKLDYYEDSHRRGCKLAKTPASETVLYKSNDEYTSPINKVLQVDSEAGNQTDIICVSENSIYIVHSNILAK